jgi:hypothetical protein
MKINIAIMMFFIYSVCFAGGDKVNSSPSTSSETALVLEESLKPTTPKEATFDDDNAALMEFLKPSPPRQASFDDSIPSK